MGLCCLPWIFVQAQELPNAGTLLQQIERDRERANQPVLPQPKPATPPPLQALPGPTVTVAEFRFAGNRLLPDARLAAAVAPFLNRPLSFSALQAAAAAAGNVYREAGWVVRAYLPQQDIDPAQGIVTIQIVEAVFGEVRLDGIAQPQTLRTRSGRLAGIVNRALPRGEPVHVRSLDRALLLLEDLPGVAVSGQLAEGGANQETDLLLSAQPKTLFSGDIGVDNTGSRSTGRGRITGNFSFNSPWGLDEQLGSYFLFTEGSRYGRLSAAILPGHDGWRLGGNVSYLRYRVITPEFEALAVRGTSTTAALDAAYPLLRAREQNLNLSLAAEHKRFDNEASGATTTRYSLGTLSFTLNGSLIDNWGGGGANSASVALIQGRLNLDDSPNQAADAATTRTDGDFTKLRYSLSRQQVLTDSLAAYAALSGQWASKNLDSAEKFYLGGNSGVRAYPSSEAGGAEGQMLNLELRTRLPYNLSLTGFYDWGRVTVNADNDFPGAPERNVLILRGAGFILGWQGASGLSIKGTLARRLGDNPNSTASGNDQDGTLIRNRLWLTVNFPC